MTATYRGTLGHEITQLSLETPPLSQKTMRAYDSIYVKYPGGDGRDGSGVKALATRAR